MRKTGFCNFKLRAFESFEKSFGNLKGSYRDSPRQQQQAADLNGLSHPTLEFAHRQVKLAEAHPR
jgi:hypothetical protein